MNIDGASQQGADGEEYPAWFSAYLRSLNVKKEEVRAAELDMVLKSCEEVSEIFRSNISAARSETKLEAARKAEAEALTQNLLHNPVSYNAPYPEFPWSLISPEQGKICSRLSDDLKPLDFSSKSLKTWSTHFKDLFSKKFVHERMARISIIHNSCSSPLQQQLLSLNIRAKAENEEFCYQELLQVICTLLNSPNHTELALQQLYAGMKQTGADSTSVFLEKVRSISEDAYGLSSTWTMNQTATVLQKVVGGLKNKDLAQLTSSIVIVLPFNYNTFWDTVCQFESRLSSPPPAVHAIEDAAKCWKCGGGHLQRECLVLSCFKCSGMHKTVNCKTPKSKLTCSKCNLQNHTTEAHRELPGRSAPRVNAVEEVGVFACYSSATSFVDGGVSLKNGGKTFFVNSKLLVDTGALMPSGSLFLQYLVLS